MGKRVASSLAKAGMSKPGIGERKTAWPSFYGGLNPKCRRCGKSQRGGSPCQCAEPDFPNERRNRAVLFQEFSEAWARLAFDLLKPGGHLLAFSGTRTYHRMTCAIEDAGFEVRDMIQWIYGSGFPKSLDDSKAIDKAAGAEREMIAPAPYKRGRASQAYSDTRRVSYDYQPDPITSPATDAARGWDG
jgi:ribosomal protein L37E